MERAAVAPHPVEHDRQAAREGEGFGWIKTVGGQRETRFRGRDRAGWAFAFTAAAYNLVRLPKLLGALA